MGEFLGDSVVFTGESRERTETGAWNRVFNYEGVYDAISGVAGNVTRKATVNFDGSDGVGRVGVRFGTVNEDGEETVSEKWEVDKELLEKDILFAAAARVLSETAKQEFRRWKNDPDSELDFTLDGISDADVVILDGLKTEVLRGVESVQNYTIVLKRTRKMSADRQTQIQLTEELRFYTTEKLISLEGVPSDISGKLPTNPYSAPSGTAWGWLPRAASREYPGKGQVEEYNDWVFAAWSTTLYTKVGVS